MSVLYCSQKSNLNQPHTSPSVQYMSAVVHTYACVFVSMIAQNVVNWFCQISQDGSSPVDIETTEWSRIWIEGFVALVKVCMYSNVQLLLSLEWGSLFPTYRQVSPKWKLVLLNWKMTADRKMPPVSWCIINYLCTSPKGCPHSGIISKAENSEH